MITAREALSELLVADGDRADDGTIRDEAEYVEANRVFIEVVGEDAADRLAEIATAERMSPSDMAAVGRDMDATEALLARLVK